MLAGRPDDMKARRQSVILDVVREQHVRSQEQLRRRIRGRLRRHAGDAVAGHPRAGAGQGWTRGRVSGAAAGRDQRPYAASVFQRALASQLRRIDRVQQLVLLRTGLGHAQSLCALLDGAGLPDVVGTLAGEDTILIITPDTRRARGLVKRLEMSNP